MLPAISSSLPRYASFNGEATRTPVRDINRIRSSLALALLLVFAQQAAMLPELSHVYHPGTAHLQNAQIFDG